MIIHSDKVDTITACAIYAMMIAQKENDNSRVYKYSDNWQSAKSDEPIAIIAHGDEFSAGSLNADQLMFHLRKILPQNYKGTIKFISCLTGKYMSDLDPIANEIFSRLKKEKYRNFTITAPKGPLMVYVNSEGKISKTVLNPRTIMDYSCFENELHLMNAEKLFKVELKNVDFESCRQIHTKASPYLAYLEKLYVKADVVLSNKPFIVLQ